MSGTGVRKLRQNGFIKVTIDKIQNHLCKYMQKSIIIECMKNK